MKFNKNLFEKGNNVLIADEVKSGMIIALAKNKYFYVDDTDSEFINDEVSKLYTGDFGECIKPEHTKITFYDEEENCITNVPGTAEIIVYTRIIGNHNKI